VTDRVYNIGTGTELSLGQLANGLLRVMGGTSPIEYGPARSVNPVPRRLADVSRARQEIGFEAAIAFEDGLRNLVAWWEREFRAEKVPA
jgi:UDP-glucose 4-epimerase